MHLEEAIRRFLNLENIDLENDEQFDRWLEGSIGKAPEYPLINLTTIDEMYLNEEEYNISTLETSSTTNVSISHSSDYGPDWLSRIAFALSGNELCEQIVCILGGKIECVESDLMDLLGFENIDFVSQLVSNRAIILEKTRHHRFVIDTVPVSIVYNQLPGQKVTLMTESAKLELKQYQKLRSQGLIPDEVNTTNEYSVNNNASANPVCPNRVNQLPHVYASSLPSMAFQGKFALPIGTEHYDDSIHEEFIIPYSQDTSRADDIKPVIIEDLDDDLLQQGFSGYRSLNKMQSVVFPVAHFTNENLLVCAPTGAGKTDVAMLTILKTMRDHIVNQSLLKNEFKIVYVAPMKALAAEITGKFSKRLKHLNMKVREYTGDMQLTRREIQETQMIVTTPEKWDVITRKGMGDIDLVAKVRLLIIDEVHLLQDDRGPVIETIVARTLREVEISQRMIRIVGLSATLPNYVDVAMFLRVDLANGLFVFGDTFRPVPLIQHFIGIKGRNQPTFNENLTGICFEKCREYIANEHQVMIFVHSRMDTIRTAKQLLRLATESSCAGLFLPKSVDVSYNQAKRQIDKSRNQELQSLFNAGFAFHHAGMVRSDRSLVESLFSAGHIKVLCCTATLAWGVNLPAHAVIIKGTQVYDQSKGDFVSLGVLDVLQIFGRAGRPQFETRGEGLILTPHSDLTRYINSILSQIPIESQFLSHLADNLNAEIALGTVSNIEEAVTWLKYSYLYVRMQRNPIAYGISPFELSNNFDLASKLGKICRETAGQLRDCGMISYDQNGVLRSRDVGRISSTFYLTIQTIESFGKVLTPIMNEEDILAIASSATEFSNLKVREEELQELDHLYQNTPMRVKHDVTTYAGKASLLILAYISNYGLETFSLISDSNYIAQNGGRVFRALFEILKAQGWLSASLRCLTMCKAFERQVWPMEHPLCQYKTLSTEIIQKLNDNSRLSMESLTLMSHNEISTLIGNDRATNLVKRLVRSFPNLQISATIHPITAKILRIDLCIKPAYSFDESLYGTEDLWWIFVENPLVPNLLHCDGFSISKHNLFMERAFAIYIPFPDPFPSQIYIRVVSDRWLHAETTIPLTVAHLCLPENEMNFTNLLSLKPLPISALHNEKLETLYSSQWLFFNAVQTQVFHSLYHDDRNVLIGAPTGSGKTVLAELAIWNALRNYSENGKIVYIAPLKALLKEKLADWQKRLHPLDLPVIELSGDTNPDQKSIKKARIILTTPEKWDSITRGNRAPHNVVLLIVDEIHLLGAERGQTLEMIIMRRKSEGRKVRLIGLSTALSNATDLARWMGPETIQFNFRPNVRPVPLEVRIEGFAGRHYCPRMAAMNKSIYSAIVSHSPDRPVLIFVSSRRQTRLTANALISYCVHNNNSHRFINMDQEELHCLLDNVKDGPLKHSLSFGIALHHAGLTEEDRRLGEVLFALGKLQVMIATSTLAWGVNFPAHLVVVKGTEYYDAHIHGYVDYSLTDVMQMIGRAGRPQFDTSAKAVLLVQNSKKSFYKTFLYESFPLESSLHIKEFLADHLNAEIANGRIFDISSAVIMLKDTFLAIRIGKNPNYYGLKSSTQSSCDEFLSKLVVDSLNKLELSDCIELDHNGIAKATDAGKIASHFYICHRTIRVFMEMIGEKDDFGQLLRILSLATEFDEAPLRHNEDYEMMNLANLPALRHTIEDLVGPLFFSTATAWDDPHTKVFVLLVAYLMGIDLPVMDFVTDIKSIMEQSMRLVQAMAEFTRSQLHLESFINCIWLIQSLQHGVLPFKENTCRIPGISAVIPTCLPELLHARSNSKYELGLSPEESQLLLRYIKSLPEVKVSYKIEPLDGGGHVFRVRLDGAEKNDRDIWRILLGDKSNNTIIAHAKLTSSRPRVDIPYELSLNEISRVTLFVLSENYMGIDQEGIRAITRYKTIASWLDSLTPQSIEREKFEWRFSKSSGPGGQHVNKVNTKAELRFKLGEATWIPSEVREYLAAKEELHIMVIKSDAHRSQEENKWTCVQKLVEMLSAHVKKMVPKPTSDEQFEKVEILKAREKNKKRELKERHSLKKKDRRILSPFDD